MRNIAKILAIVVIAFMIAGLSGRLPVQAEEDTNTEQTSEAEGEQTGETAGTETDAEEGKEQAEETAGIETDAEAGKEQAEEAVGTETDTDDETEDEEEPAEDESDVDEDEYDPSVISPKAQLGSLAQTEKGSGLLHTYDRANKVTPDTDAVFEKQYSKMTYKKNGYTKKELKLLSALIYCEANSMCFEAKVAVVNVVLNRMNNKDPNYWGHCNTIYDVIYDNRWGIQFSPTYSENGKPSSLDKAMALYSGLDSGEYENWQIRAMNSCIEAAKAALAGYKTVPDTFMYFNSHLETSREKCQTQGRPFSIIERHIYFK